MFVLVWDFIFLSLSPCLNPGVRTACFPFHLKRTFLKSKTLYHLSHRNSNLKIKQNRILVKHTEEAVNWLFFF